MLEDQVEDHLPVVAGPVADVDQPDNVGMVVLAEVAEEGDLPEDGHGHPVLRQRNSHLLHCHNLLCLEVLGLVHRSIGACKQKCRLWL